MFFFSYVLCCLQGKSLPWTSFHYCDVCSPLFLCVICFVNGYARTRKVFLICLHSFSIAEISCSYLQILYGLSFYSTVHCVNFGSSFGTFLDVKHTIFMMLFFGSAQNQRGTSAENYQGTTCTHAHPPTHPIQWWGLQLFSVRPLHPRCSAVPSLHTCSVVSPVEPRLSHPVEHG